ncbi:MAG: NmrA family NAD(P)-binding protein [Bdellovibrionales bacterium]|nr:NmrA family NAD(P)-binding protein [Bdellovibrionales bacterium]
MKRFLVIGASGTVGSELSKILQTMGLEVRKATSKQKTASDQVHVDLLTGKGVPEALNRIDGLFLMAPPGHVNQHEILNPVIDQAKAAGVRKIVLMTAMGANAIETAPFRQVEIKLEKSGVNYNIIRPNWFMQNFNTFWIQGILSAGKIFLPVEKAKGSFIDARDIAAVAAKLLTSDQRNNQDFDLTGDEALDHDQVAEILSKATGKKISYENISPAAMLEGLLQAGLGRPYSEFLLMILDFFRQGYAQRTTDSVKAILGRDPIRFEKYAQDYRTAWKG